MEIKLRAWDKLRKEWLSAGQILISIGPGSDPEINIYLDVADGKEIWERDRVKWRAWGPLSHEYPEEGRTEYEGLGTVVYDVKSACFYIDGDEVPLFVFYPTEPVEVGTPLSDDPKTTDLALVFKFEKPESIDVLIKTLQIHRNIICAEIERKKSEVSVNVH